jgi:nucleoside recognition membrane protein YjiH
MTIQLIPQEALDEEIFNSHVRNLVADFAEALSKTSNEACLNWATQAGMKDNVFMENKLTENILSTFIGFLTMAQPRAYQLTDEHFDDYLQISSEPNPPAKDPVLGE